MPGVDLVLPQEVTDLSGKNPIKLPVAEGSLYAAVGKITKTDPAKLRAAVIDTAITRLSAEAGEKSLGLQPITSFIVSRQMYDGDLVVSLVQDTGWRTPPAKTVETPGSTTNPGFFTPTDGQSARNAQVLTMKLLATYLGRPLTLHFGTAQDKSVTYTPFSPTKNAPIELNAASTFDESGLGRPTFTPRPTK